MQARVIEASKPILQLVDELDKIFLNGDAIQAVNVNTVDTIPKNDLIAYAHYRGMYTIVTHELVQWLKLFIGRKAKAIEIGAGNGTLGNALSIHTTDNHLQTRQDIALAYMLMGQPVIKYPRFVEKLEAIDAIKKYKPDVVIASWFSHKWRDSEPQLEGNQWAADEEEIMSLCKRYVLVGNLQTHQRNRLFNTSKYNCKLYQPHGLRSRAIDSDANAVIEFTKK